MVSEMLLLFFAIYSRLWELRTPLPAEAMVFLGIAPPLGLGLWRMVLDSLTSSLLTIKSRSGHCNAKISPSLLFKKTALVIFFRPWQFLFWCSTTTAPLIFSCSKVFCYVNSWTLISFLSSIRLHCKWWSGFLSTDPLYNLMAFCHTNIWTAWVNVRKLLKTCFSKNQHNLVFIRNW